MAGRVRTQSIILEDTVTFYNCNPLLFTKLYSDIILREFNIVSGTIMAWCHLGN